MLAFWCADKKLRREKNRERTWQVLNLEGNSLSSLPDTLISSLRSLEKLDLRANLLESLPAAALGALPRLQELLLRDNRLPDLYMDKVSSCCSSSCCCCCPAG